MHIQRVYMYIYTLDIYAIYIYLTIVYNILYVYAYICTYKVYVHKYMHICAYFFVIQYYNTLRNEGALSTYFFL